METTIKKLPDSTLEISAPFILTLGRKTRLITRPARFVVKSEIAVCKSDESFLDQYSFRLPSHDKYELHIDGRLFSVTVPSGRKRGTAFLAKPRKKDRKIEIRLVKKYTTVVDN